MLYIDDRFIRHPKLLKAGALLGDNGAALALAVYMEGLSYARQHLTDGYVPAEYLKSSCLVSQPHLVVNALVSRGVRLLHRAPGGYRIHDYLHWNKKASDIKEKREKERVKKAAQRKRVAEPSPGASPGGQIVDLARARGTVTTEPRNHVTTTGTTNQPVPAAEPPTEARSKRPIFSCSRFVVWEWLFDDLRKLLGPHLEDFCLDEWFYTLSARADSERLMLSKHDAGRWIYDQTVLEAQRRGLKVAQGTNNTPHPLGQSMFQPGTGIEDIAEGLRRAREAGKL